MGRKSRGTKLKELPDESDEETDSQGLAVLNKILNVQKESPEEYSTVKLVFYATGIFLLLSLPFTDRLFELAMPVAGSWLVLLGLKTIIFFICLYITIHFTKQKV